ncbi:hypothetical protein [Acidovorax sp. Root568]|uniref:hypothetical protein n=1 Tax=Acidovorax sp. Root568 TaxID=1736565 RepID=UPI0012E391F1|nr:hypothetical protein [Acidovorax sp. Root568]
MKRIISNWLVGLLHPLFERLRTYFSASTVIALEQLRQEVRELRQSIIEPAANSMTGISLEAPVTPQHALHDVAPEHVHAGLLHSLHTQWWCHGDLLQRCRLVIACPLTAEAACGLFQSAEVVVVATQKDWADVLTGRRWDAIAVVGLDLMKLALQSPQVPFQLIRACRSDLFYFSQVRDDLATQRRSLHKIGFFEIASVLSDGELDHITHGWSADGDFLLLGSQPGLSGTGGAWCLHRASRLGQPEGVRTTKWRSVLNSGLRDSALGWIGAQNTLSLSIYQNDADKAITTGYYQKIQAVMQWPLHRVEGHASLVGAYHGPGDTAMVLAMIQSIQPGTAVLSIWLHDGAWKCLSTKEVPPEECQIQAECVRITCWLNLTATQVRAGCGPHPLIELPVAHGLYAAAAGIRVYGQHIAVSEFGFHMDQDCG